MLQTKKLKKYVAPLLSLGISELFFRYKFNDIANVDSIRGWNQGNLYEPVSNHCTKNEVFH